MERVYSPTSANVRSRIGETVVSREPDSASRSVNGDVLRVAGQLNDARRLALARERDGATVRRDVQEKPPQPAVSAGHFRIRENAEIPNDWGRFPDARAFAEHLKTMPIGRVWRTELSETGDSVSLKNFFTSIKDSGHSLSAKGKAERDATAAVDLAAEKGWKSITVEGSEESRLSVVVAAVKRSINVEGIAKEVLAKAKSIAKALTPKPGWKP